MVLHVGDPVICKSTRTRYRVKSRQLIKGSMWRFSFCSDPGKHVLISCDEDKIESRFLVCMPLHKTEPSPPAEVHAHRLDDGW